MKNIFNVNLDQMDEGKGKRLDGYRFATKYVNSELISQISAASADNAKLSQKASLPSWYVIMENGTLIATACVFLLALRSGLHFFQFFMANPLVLLGGLAALGIFLYLRYNETNFRTKRRNTEQFRQSKQLQDELTEKAYTELKVPRDAAAIDVLGRPYHVRRGKEVRDDILESSNLDYINFVYRVYLRGRKLCFANSEAEYAIPVHAITGWKSVKRRVALPRWNKKIPPNDSSFRKYHISGSVEKITAKCYSLQIFDKTDDFEILIPNYDAHTVAKLIAQPLPD